MSGENEKFPRGKFLKFLIVIAGIILGQAILYGPSLIGEKILLPLDILTQADVYIPPTPETVKIEPHDFIPSDLIYQFEPARHFAASEIHQGRFPLWAPYHYGGVPFVWPKYSLFLLLESSTKSPVILAWTQLVEALVAGVGMYFFCRRTLGVGFWPSAICAWCYPLTAFFVLWQGFPTAMAVYWLPWIFLAVDETVRGQNPCAPIGLSIVTFLVLTSGHIDVAGQVLLGSGIFSIWRSWDVHRKKMFQSKFSKAIAALVAGWFLGFLLAAPHILPLLEYAKTGARITQRSAGMEERPPTGIAALPQIVLPDIYGTTEKGSTFLMPASSNLLESASAGYAGVLAALLVAPLAFCNSRYRAMNLFWIFLAFFGLSWCLNVPGFVQLLRLPPLNMMSHNRLVFLTSFSILSMAAIGLENFLTGCVQRRRWFWIPAIFLAGLCVWCIYRSDALPKTMADQSHFETFYKSTWGNGQIVKDVHQIQAWFIRRYTIMAELCLLGFIGWLLLWFQKFQRRHLFAAFAIFLLGDLLHFDYGRNAQCDPSLYFPKVPVLEKIAASVLGRVIGSPPASIVSMAGLSDIRGYDSIDSARMVKLLQNASVVQKVFPPYAATMLLMPQGIFSAPSSLRLSAIFDMLDVRYVIFRGSPPPDIHPPFQSNDYWVMINSNALPRAFVPKSVRVATNADDELKELCSPQFKPAETAYVEAPISLTGPIYGAAQITNEIPTRIFISVQMQTPGLVVLADNWDKGWRAFYNGKRVPVLRTDYAIRGVVVPAGNGTLEFIYKPSSLILGLWLAGFAVVVLLGWFVIIKIKNPFTPESAG